MLSDPAAASEVKLVLLDVSMPGLTGRELRARIRAVAPGAKILYCTGFASGTVDAEDRVLEKPFTGPRLLQIVREVLDGQEAL